MTTPAQRDSSDYGPQARAPEGVGGYDRDWLRSHIEAERRQTERLGEIREAVFGAQDALVSTLAVVSTVGGATEDRFPILVAGLASALAGVFSMSIGEYTSSKSQREIYDNAIHRERHEVRERPAEAEAEVAYLLEEEGLRPDAARDVASRLATNEEVLLKTMVEKEHGIVSGLGAGPVQGALVMGASFAIGSVVPLLPYLILPVRTALPVSILLTGAVLFAIGAAKSRWTLRSALTSGLELTLFAAIAAVAGYFFGTLLPGLVGVAPPPG